MEFLFLLLFPVIIIVLPILAALGIPLSAALIALGVFLLFVTLISKWICDGAEASYAWCLLPAVLAAACFVGSRLIPNDLNLMQILQSLFR